MLSENSYLHLFRTLVLNQPLKDQVPFIVQQQSEPSFREFLLWNRLSPLLYHRLRQQKSESFFPENFITWLKSSHYKQVTLSLQQEAVIKEILMLLSREGIQPILLKGIALAYSVYENPALRPMLDIDLLFNAGYDIQARSVLLKHGGIETYAEESRHTTGLWHHIPPINFKGVVVELHTMYNLQFGPYLHLSSLIFYLFSNNPWLLSYVEISRRVVSNKIKNGNGSALEVNRINLKAF